MLKKIDRPRELKWYHASALLYGDWGTSKAYVLGIAFALAGHASWFFLGLMSLLTALVGVCYMVICRVSPDGGGVYSSVRGRSKSLAVLGALLLIADYVITASLSALDAFHYFQLPYPEWWAIGALIGIGAINWIGPRRGGDVAAVIGTTAALTILFLLVCAAPQIQHVQLTLPQNNWPANWAVFVGIVLALSGVEAIANMTGIMVEPVERTSRKAIWPVLLEVSIATFLLGLAMNSIPGLQGHTEDMLHAMGEHFVGAWFAKLISLVFGFLLLSAANTAITDFVSILFLMSKDRELPDIFGRLNRFGMPWLALILAVLAPALVLVFEHDLVQLAALYAIGVVGAITLNLGFTATNFQILLKKRERILLGAAAGVLFLIECTIAVQKRQALVFASVIVIGGLVFRFLSKKFAAAPTELAVPSVEVLTVAEAREISALYQGSSIVAIRALNTRLIEEASLRAKVKGENSIYIVYVEEAPRAPELVEAAPSAESVRLLHDAINEAARWGINAVPVWQLGENPGKLLSLAARELGVTAVLIGTSRRSGLIRLLRGDVLRVLARDLPTDCHLHIIG